MKKHFLVCLFAALSLGSVVTSCSDDDDAIVCPIEQTTTFNAENGLELTYSGAPMLGKQVVFTPNSLDPTKATLVISGAALSQSEVLPFELPSIGVIPGESTTTLNVDLAINGDAVSFQGEVTDEAKTIKYEGTASKSSLKLNLNVVMASNSVQGKKIALFEDKTGKDALAPIKFEWLVMAEDSWTGEVVEQDASVYVKMALIMAKIGDLSISQCLQGVLKEVTFLPDGNIQAFYRDEPTSGDFKQSPLNLAFYTTPKEGEIRLFLNVPQIIEEATKAKSKADKTPATGNDLLPYLAEVMPQLIKMVPDLLTNGIKINYSVDEKGVMFLYLDKDILLPILQSFKPVLLNKDFLDTLGEVVDGAMPGFGSTVKVVVMGVANLFDTTTTLKLGVNFVEVK